MPIKTALLLGGAVISASFVSGYLIKYGPDDPTGFVEASPGFGLDEIVHAGVVIGLFVLGKKLLGG